MTIQELLTLKTGKSRILGLDVGDKTVGLALCDTLWSIATPHQTLSRKSFAHDVGIFQKLLADYSIAAMVVGLPLHMSGRLGDQAQKVQRYANQLAQDLGVPIFFQDERLSTSAVERTLLSADVSRQKRGKVIDKMAASFILQGVLDTLFYASRGWINTPHA